MILSQQDTQQEKGENDNDYSLHWRATVSTIYIEMKVKRLLMGRLKTLIQWEKKTEKNYSLSNAPNAVIHSLSAITKQSWRIHTGESKTYAHPRPV